LSASELELISAGWRRVELAAPARHGVVTRVRSLLSRLRAAAGSGRTG
jgi:hypothetical protein